MENNRFDALARSLAAGGNRRQLLKGLLGLGGAAIAGNALANDADAARRPTPTPKPPTCPANKHWNGSQCVCTTGETCGPACCLIGSECCDGACCFGHCYGEELCCSYDDWCADSNECCAAGEICCAGVGCRTPENCCIPSCDGATCGSDGCGGTCACSSDKICSQGTCICPPGTMLCADGICAECCVLANQSDECATTQGGSAGCWVCSMPDGVNKICSPWSAGCPIPGVGLGYCGTDDHVCYPYKANGDPCTANRECSSGICSPAGLCSGV